MIITATIDLSELSYLADKLAADIESAIRGEVMNVCKETLIRFVQSGVYGAYSPIAYQRTMDFISAVSIKDIVISGTHASFTVFVDGSKFSLVHPEKGAFLKPYAMWGKHVRFGGGSYTNALVEAMDKSGISWNTPYASGSRPAAHFYKNTASDLEKTIPRILRAALAAKGWNVY